MTPSSRPDDESELRKEIRRAVREGQMEVANYSEGNHSFLKWVLALCGGLALTGVTGGIAMYAKLSALEERTLNIQYQLNDLKRVVEPRYRGDQQP